MPTLRLLDPNENQKRYHDRRQSTPEHGAPAVAGSHRVIEYGGQEEAGIVAGLQIAGAHLAAVFRPRFSNISAGQRPFASNSNPGQQAEQSQLPHILRQCGKAGEYGVDKDRARQHAAAAKLISNRSPYQRESPSKKKQRKQNRPRPSHVGGSGLNAGSGEQFSQRGIED